MAFLGAKRHLLRPLLDAFPLEVVVSLSVYMFVVMLAFPFHGQILVADPREKLTIDVSIQRFGADGYDARRSVMPQPPKRRVRRVPLFHNQPFQLIAQCMIVPDRKRPTLVRRPFLCHALACVAEVSPHIPIVAVQLLHGSLSHFSLYRPPIATKQLCDFLDRVPGFEQRFDLASLPRLQLFPFPTRCGILFLTHSCHLGCFVAMQPHCT